MSPSWYCASPSCGFTAAASVALQQDIIPVGRKALWVKRKTNEADSSPESITPDLRAFIESVIVPILVERMITEQQKPIQKTEQPCA